MYLNELYRFYLRMSANAESGMPPPGMSEENIAFVLVISLSGELREVVSLCDSKGKPRRLFVPAAVKRTVGIAPNFLWDNTSYVLGVDSKGKAARTRQAFEAFKERTDRVAKNSHNPRLTALASFLETWDPERFASLPDQEAMLDQQLVFKIEGDDTFLHLQPDVVALWTQLLTQGDGEKGTCLITGEQACIAAVHPSVKGVPGAQSAGAALVSFNCPSFESYGKEQSFNAPTGETAARGYVAALNYLLRRENKQCLQIGDARAVFWAERASPSEQFFAQFCDLEEESKEDSAEQTAEQTQDAAQVARVRSFLRAFREGRPVESFLHELDGNVRFFVLGLSPNAARLSVRFWLADTFGALACKVARHYADCAIERRYPNDPEFPTLYQLLLSLAPQGKSENIPPLLGGQLTRCILTGTPYPESLYATVLQRIHADKQVSYLRVSLMAAYLRRNLKRRDITMSLNPERSDIPYLLGRLFAVLEKVQQDALGKVNCTIRDRYISAASATPAHVFPLLLRLAQHHISKAEYGWKTSRTINEIMDKVDTIPVRIPLARQADFFIGYSHQSVANYAKKNDISTETINTEE